MKFAISNRSSIFNDVSLEDRIRMASELPFYYQTAATIDSVLSRTMASQEALNSNFLGRIFVSVVDSFTGLLNTFKTNIFKFRIPLKRSELREYVESNRMKVSVVESLPYDKVCEFPVDIPAHLNVTFKTAIDDISIVHVKLNALPRAEAAYNSLVDLYKDLTNRTGDYPQLIKNFVEQTTPAMNAIRPLVLKCQQNFSGTMTAKKVYKLVYADTKEFVACKNELLELEQRLQDIHRIKEIIGNIEQQLKAIVKVIDGDSDVSINSDLLGKFGEALKSLALLFDSVQLASTRQVTLEHNTILNYNNIFAKVR